jgi:hypothetical protein
MSDRLGRRGGQNLETVALCPCARDWMTGGYITSLRQIYTQTLCIRWQVFLNLYPLDGVKLEFTWYAGHQWSSRWNENWKGKPKYSEKTSSSFSLSIRNPTWPWIKSRPPWREAGDWPPELWHSFTSVGCCSEKQRQCCSCQGDREMCCRITLLTKAPNQPLSLRSEG